MMILTLWLGVASAEEPTGVQIKNHHSDDELITGMPSSSVGSYVYEHEMKFTTAPGALADGANWEVSDVTELENALNSFGDGDTIKLMANIDYRKGIVVEGKTVTFDVGSYTLDVVNSTGIGIDIKNAILTVSGDGKLNVSGTKGIQAHNSKISVYSATGTAGAGVEASCEIDKSCEVTVTTLAKGTTAGVYAMNNNCKITAASTIATGEGGKAVYAEIGGTVEISENVDAPNGHGVYCVNSSATIGGSVTSKDTAVYLYEKGSIVINGNVNADNGSGTAVEIDGNGNPSNGTVTIGGTVSASDAFYVCFVNGFRTKNEGVPDGAYLKYMDSIDGEKAGIILVKKEPAVCTIGAQEFPSLDAAIASVPAGSTATITLLQSIIHTKPVRVEKKTINLDLGDYNLFLDTSVSHPDEIAFMVENGGKVNLTGTGTGQFNVKGAKTAISILGTSSTATVDNVETTSDSNGVYMGNGGSITVKGDIKAEKGNGIEVNAAKGEVVVNGNITAGRIGVITSANLGVKVTIKGDINVTSDNEYEPVGIRAYDETNVEVAGNVTVRGTNCVGICAYGATINIDGNVVSYGTGAEATNNGNVTIHGSLSAGTPFIIVGPTEMTPDQGIKADEGFLVYTDGKSIVRIGSVGEPESTYTVTLNGGGTGAIGAGNYKKEAIVNIYAGERSGYNFNGWTSPDGVIFANPGNARTTFTMPAKNVTITANWKSSGSSSGGGGGGISQPSVPTINAVVKAGNYQENYPITVNKSDNLAIANLSSEDFNTAVEKAKADSDGVKTVNIIFPSVQDTNSYALGLPASAFTGNENNNINMSSELGSLILPSNMLNNAEIEDEKNIEICITKADKSELSKDVQNQIGDRPIVAFKIKQGERVIAWNNPTASVQVSIPYIPTEQELLNPEHITVWYIDGNGNVHSVPSGRYNSNTGMVTFNVTHFSSYAVTYVTKTFDDLGGVAWAKKPIEVLTSKGILEGISDTKYAPHTNITRADFLYFLIRTLSVEASFDENFDDINSDAYYYKEIGVAKKLGITSGVGNNHFSPDSKISRQDMIALTERALRMYKDIKAADETSELDKFTDKSLISDYALNSVATLVNEGLIEGSNNKINPRGNTTRAEAAVFLYKIYNKY